MIYDVHHTIVVLRLSFPASIESLTCNSAQDFLCAGSSTASIYLVDLTMTAVTLSTTSHNLVRHQSVVNRPEGRQLECGESGSNSSAGRMEATRVRGEWKRVRRAKQDRYKSVLLLRQRYPSVRIDGWMTDQTVPDRILSLGISNLSVRYVQCPLP